MAQTLPELEEDRWKAGWGAGRTGLERLSTEGGSGDFPALPLVRDAWDGA